MAATWNLLKELQAKRREADERDDTVLDLARQALAKIKIEALEIADGKKGDQRSWGSFRIAFGGSAGGNSYARMPVAKKLVELLKAEGIQNPQLDNCYETVSFSW